MWRRSVGSKETNYTMEKGSNELGQREIITRDWRRYKIVWKSESLFTSLRNIIVERTKISSSSTPESGTSWIFRVEGKSSNSSSHASTNDFNDIFFHIFPPFFPTPTLKYPTSFHCQFLLINTLLAFYLVSFKSGSFRRISLIKKFCRLFMPCQSAKCLNVTNSSSRDFLVNN